MLKYIINFIKNNFNYNRKKNRTITLGRWKIEKNDYITDLKISNANEDHCGTCYYTQKKITKK